MGMIWTVVFFPVLPVQLPGQDALESRRSSWGFTEEWAMEEEGVLGVTQICALFRCRNAVELFLPDRAVSRDVRREVPREGGVTFSGQKLDSDT